MYLQKWLVVEVKETYQVLISIKEIQIFYSSAQLQLKGKILNQSGEREIGRTIGIDLDSILVVPGSLQLVMVIKEVDGKLVGVEVVGEEDISSEEGEVGVDSEAEVETLITAGMEDLIIIRVKTGVSITITVSNKDIRIKTIVRDIFILVCWRTPGLN